MVCSACGTGYDSPATSCPRCGTPAGVVVTRRVGLFALACLHIARVAALLDVLAVLAASALVPSNGHDFLAAFLVMLGVPVSIGPLCRFRTDNRVCTHTVEFFPTPGRCSQRTFEVGPRKDHRGGDLISDALPFGRLWHNEPDALYNAIGYAKFRSRSHRAVICVYDSAGNPA
jgi:hypothetical protein